MLYEGEMAEARRPVSGLPLREGAAGEATRDVQRRLMALGFAVPGAEIGRYGPGTAEAVRTFQGSRGLHVDGVCGPQTWSSLVEAGYQLGDRFLYLRSPMLRGDDVSDLQRQLGRLGFDAGRVDGIFGVRTSQALRDFQRNAGLTTDGICGTDAIAALGRLGNGSGRATPVVAVREQERLLGSPRNLLGRRIAVGETGGMAAIADALGRLLLDGGAVVEVLHHPDGSAQADEANDFKAEVFVGLGVLDEVECAISYFAVEGYESVGGRRLAELALAVLPPVLGQTGTVRGMRLPVLRETRMPAVVCEMGPAALVVERGAALVASLEGALSEWAASPLGS